RVREDDVDVVACAGPVGHGAQHRAGGHVDVRGHGLVLLEPCERERGERARRRRGGGRGSRRGRRAPAAAAAEPEDREDRDRELGGLRQPQGWHPSLPGTQGSKVIRMSFEPTSPNVTKTVKGPGFATTYLCCQGEGKPPSLTASGGSRYQTMPLPSPEG